jgi:hypothetical protein
MPAQFRMPQEDPTTGAQPRLPGGDQPQGMFAHRSRGQHSLNQVTHTFVTVGHRNNWISLNVIYSNLHQLLQYQLNSMQRTHTLYLVSLTISLPVLQWLLPLYINQMICFNDSCLTANNYLSICINV